MTASPPSLRRFAGILLALAVVPALAFAAAQVFVQSESEAQLAQLRDEQLDGLLFSVNQNAWDVAATWAERLSWIRADGGPTNLSWLASMELLNSIPAVESFIVADTTLNLQMAYSDVPGGPSQADAAGLSEYVAPGLVRSLLEQQTLGYRKLEPIPLPDGRLGLVFVAEGGRVDAASGPPRVLCLVVAPEPFVQTVVMPKLREVALGGVELGVFRDGQDEPLAATARLTHPDVERERPLWLLPEHTVGARVGEGSAEAMLRRRLFQSLGLLGGVTLVLGAGALAAWRGVRREVEVARLRADFVSNVSHELRTPLALVRMYAETLVQGRVPEGKRPRYYATILAETERLSRLVGNVLHFSRFERGTAQLATAPLDVGALVAEIAERYRPVVEREGGTLAAHIEPDVPAVRGDHDALAEALVNLIDNAVKYGGPGAVDVTAAPHADPGAGSVVLDVSDRGPGLAAADRERVFEPFVRVQPESADGLVHTAKGTGLGLALVRRIAEAHGGTATALARDGGGATFRLTLPADPAHV